MTAKSNLEQNQEILMEQLELLHKKIGRIEDQSKGEASEEEKQILQQILKSLDDFKKLSNADVLKKLRETQKLLRDEINKKPYWLDPIINAFKLLRDSIQSTRVNQHTEEKIDAALIAIVDVSKRMEKITEIQTRLIKSKKWYEYYPHAVTVVSISMLIMVLAYTKEMRDESFKRGKLDMIRTIESNYKVNLDKYYEN